MVLFLCSLLYSKTWKNCLYSVITSPSLSLRLQSSFHPYHSLKQCLSVTHHNDFHVIKSHSHFSVHVKLIFFLFDMLGYCLPLEKLFLASVRLVPFAVAPFFPSSASWNALSPATLPMEGISSSPVALIFYASDSQTLPCPFKSHPGITDLI